MQARDHAHGQTVPSGANSAGGYHQAGLRAPCMIPGRFLVTDYTSLITTRAESLLCEIQLV
jgi:hypothetical protein